MTETAHGAGWCLWANQLCEQPNHHGCLTCAALADLAENRHQRPGGNDMTAHPGHGPYLCRPGCPDFDPGPTSLGRPTRTDPLWMRVLAWLSDRFVR